MKKTIRKFMQLGLYFAIGYLVGMIVTHFLVIPNLY